VFDHLAAARAIWVILARGMSSRRHAVEIGFACLIRLALPIAVSWPTGAHRSQPSDREGIQPSQILLPWSQDWRAPEMSAHRATGYQIVLGSAGLGLSRASDIGCRVDAARPSG
jgi:hypothetical protein